MVMFETPVLDEREIDVLEAVNEAEERLRQLQRQAGDWLPLLRRAAFARHLQASNDIEGRHVSIDDAMAAVEESVPMEASPEDWRAVTGYWEAVSYICQLGTDPQFTYNSALLRSLHFMMLRHAADDMPGLYRTGVISVGAGDSEEVVFEDVPRLVDELVDALAVEQPRDSAMTIAGMAHLNLVGIRPFKAGNGLMARTAQTLVLARDSDGDLQFRAVEEYMGRNSGDYFDVLSEVGRQRDARPWIRFVLLAHYRQALTWVNRLRESERLWDALDSTRKDDGIPARNIESLYRAAMGLRVRRPDHILGAGVGERVGSSDLKILTDAGLLSSVGERRGRHYVAGQRLKKLRGRIQESPAPLPDPFG